MYTVISVEQSNLETVSEMLTSGRIQRVYLDELGEIETLPVGLSLMVLTTLEGEDAQSEARKAITRAGSDSDIIEMITKIVAQSIAEGNLRTLIGAPSSGVRYLPC